MDSFSSSSNRQWINDVFINFRGEDTRKSFVSHLHAALSNAGINTYIDNQLHKGQELGPELSRAIEWSHISIVVFSKRYTESYWCLNELKKVMECHRNHGQLVLPIFYDVDPSVVRRQSGDFGEALLSTAEKSYSSGEERMEYVLSKWRSALTQAANLSGWDVNNCRSEAELMQQIVENVLEKLNTGFLPITDFPVGLESRVHEVVEFIVTQPNRLCMIGIWGMGGSGKTTTAKAIYNQIHRKFVDKCFIENIREICEKDNRGIIHVQQQLLSDILNSKEMIPNIALGTTIIERRLQGKRVLVVLDDVTTFKQLKALFRNLTFFGSGSVFIVTTRDARILKLLEVSHVCTMKEMDEKESLELFCWHAFRQPIPMIEFSELSRSVAAYCGGLPLALEVIGSSLYERTKEEWESVLSKLERIPNDQVQEKLRTSYDGLKDDMEKDIFLDICCFFIGKDRSYVTKILNGCKLHADIGITILIERCLVKIERNNKLGMHDLTRDMGREIVRKSSAKEPGKRSRLWFHQDVHDILTKNSGTETVEGLVLKLQRTSRVSFNANSFKEMKNMRLLQLDCVDLAGDYGCLSKELRWVCWQEFTMNYIPDDFYLGNLVVIDLKHSNIKQVWNETKLLGNLKILNLSHSKYLKSTPDFSKSPNLEKLIMKNCPNLSEVHQSIGDLRSLLLINLKDCKSLNNLPENIYQLKSLKTLILSGCTKIDKLEEEIVQMESLTTLIAKDTAIKEVPYSIVRSRNIEYISLCGYEGLTRDVFPSLIWSWMSPTMNSLPQISPIGNMALSLTSINAQNNNMGFLSPMIRSLSQLRTVWLQCRSKIQLTQELRRILDDKYDVNFTKWETSSSSHITNLFLRSLLIGMGSCHIVIDALGKSISQGLTANDSSGFFLPCGNYPSCLGYTGEGPSALFQVPKDIDHQLKGIILCVVYSSTSENMGAECLTSVLIVNYTKCTIQIYKRDTVMSFNGEDWKNVSSNLGPGDDVEIFVAFGHGLIVKETAVYLIYGQSITMEIESSTNMEMELSANVKVEASITTEIEQSITMEVELPTNTEMEPLAKMDVQPSPEGNMQPSPNVTVEASTNVKTNQSPEVKVRSSGIIKTNPSPAPKKSIFTRLAKRIGRCLCCN